MHEWDEKTELEWFLLDRPLHQNLQKFVKALLKIYRENPAMYELDHQWNGFEWINADDGYRSIYSFVRHSEDGKNNLLFVINFTPVAREDYKVGVPTEGKYQLILNSDDTKFGGSGSIRKKVFHAKKSECDGREYSIEYPLPAYGVAVFRF